MSRTMSPTPVTPIVRSPRPDRLMRSISRSSSPSRSISPLRAAMDRGGVSPGGGPALALRPEERQLLGERQLPGTKQPFDRFVATSPQRFSQAFMSRSPRFSPSRCFNGRDPRAIQADDPFRGEYQYAYQFQHNTRQTLVKEPKRMHSAFLSTPRPPFCPPPALYEGGGTRRLCERHLRLHSDF